jgi:hypothetical protein
MSVDYDARRREQNVPLLIFLGLIVASLGALPLLPPIPQDQSYHRFAVAIKDGRVFALELRFQARAPSTTLI